MPFVSGLGPSWCSCLFRFRWRWLEFCPSWGGGPRSLLVFTRDSRVRRRGAFLFYQFLQALPSWFCCLDSVFFFFWMVYHLDVRPDKKLLSLFSKPTLSNPALWYCADHIFPVPAAFLLDMMQWMIIREGWKPGGGAGARLLLGSPLLKALSLQWFRI